MRKYLLTMAMVLLVFGAVAASATPVLIHQARQDYYAGGTRVTGCFGSACPSEDFNVGNATGTVIWEMQEKVFYDAATNTTIYQYTVFNDASSAPITSFGVLASKIGFISASSGPLGWVYVGTATPQNAWACGSATNCAPDGHGINIGSSVDSMSVTYAGQLGVLFANVGYDTGSPGNAVAHNNDNWVGTSVQTPEPASLLLLGAGFGSLALFRRRK